MGGMRLHSLLFSKIRAHGKAQFGTRGKLMGRLAAKPTGSARAAACSGLRPRCPVARFKGWFRVVILVPAFPQVQAAFPAWAPQTARGGAYCPRGMAHPRISGSASARRWIGKVKTEMLKTETLKI